MEKPEQDMPRDVALRVCAYVALIARRRERDNNRSDAREIMKDIVVNMELNDITVRKLVEDIGSDFAVALARVESEIAAHDKLRHALAKHQTEPKLDRTVPNPELMQAFKSLLGDKFIDFDKITTTTNKKEQNPL